MLNSAEVVSISIISQIQKEFGRSWQELVSASHFLFKDVLFSSCIQLYNYLKFKKMIQQTLIAIRNAFTLWKITFYFLKEKKKYWKPWKPGTIPCLIYWTQHVSSSKEDPNSSSQSATTQSPTSCFCNNCTLKLALFCQETLTAYTINYMYCKHKGLYRLFKKKVNSTGQCLRQPNPQHFFPILSWVTCYLYALG